MVDLEFSAAEVQQFHAAVAENVRKIRKTKGVSQLDLALAIGHKSMSTIGKIEAGLEGKHYNLEHLYKIAQILKVDIREFFEGWSPTEDKRD